MAEAQEQYDFHTVLDAVWEDLVDDLELDPVLKDLEMRKVFRKSEIRDLRERHPTTTEKVHALLQLVRGGDHTQYEQFKQSLGNCGQVDLVKTIEAAEKGEYTSAVKKEPRTEEEKLLKVLKEDLIEYYREKESTMSVAPLVEQREAEITKIYVRPPMLAYNKPKAFGQKKLSDKKSGEKKSEEKTRIRSYRELLLNGNEPYRGIYVTADAGMGKTSFAKMLAVTWCETHASKDLIRDSLESRGIDLSHDIETMEKFDFLFLIKLRDFEISSKCSLDEMILEMMKSKLKHERQYTEELLETVLCNKRCLIIVDGLDEWIHPQSCWRGEVIPHRRAWPKCTVLTTTRPWKLSTARLSMADIDRQVEISGLDNFTAHELGYNAIEFLNENQRQNDQAIRNAKEVTEFESSLPKEILEHFCIPLQLLHMICLWFGNSSIGKSLCEVYSNIIELTLIRWLVKIDSGHTDCECKPSKEHENIKLKCMENNRHCQCYMPLLLKIGELAFSTLFNVIREESLLFDKEQVLNYLSKEELEQCLKMGLLSQVKDTTSLTKVRLQLYFPHKTLHEYFCALFIATNWNNVNTGTMSIKQTISNKCTSVSDILEMSEVFVFVCGLNPEVYSDISRHLATIVSTDQSVIDFRNWVVEYSGLLEEYQRMQISCLLESTRNQHPECKIVIEYIVVCRLRYVGMTENEQLALGMILSDSAVSVKSLVLSGFNEEEVCISELPGKDVVQILKKNAYLCLERLTIKDCEPTLLQSVLIDAAYTLKYLQLEDVNLRDGGLIAESGLNNLRGLCLDSVIISSDSLNDIGDCICGCLELRQLRLYVKYNLVNIDETPEQREFSIHNLLRSVETKTMLTYLSLRIDLCHQNYVLDLSKHDKLEELVLHFQLRELHINSDHIVVCEVDNKGNFSADIVSSLLAELHGAPVLEKLTLTNISNPPPRIDISVLPRLKELTLKCCVLGHSTVTLSPEMTSLETITLEKTTLNIPCCRELFLSIRRLPQPITVKLETITMTAEERRELYGIIGKLPESIHVEI